MSKCVSGNRLNKIKVDDSSYAITMHKYLKRHAYVVPSHPNSSCTFNHLFSISYKLYLP